MSSGECSVCGRQDVAEIDKALRGRTSVRQVAKTFTIGRTALANHARHMYERRPSPSIAEKPAESAPTDGVPIATELRPIESADDVVADLQRLRVEAFELFESAKKRADWKSAERVFSQLAAMVDRFGEMYKVLGPKGGVNVNIDARSIKIAQFLDALPIDTLRRIKAGELALEVLLPGAEEYHA